MVATRSALLLALCAAVACNGGGGGEPDGPPAPVSEVEPNDSCASANPLTFGATYVGTIFTVVDADYYAFDAPEGDVWMTFRTFDGTGASCSGVDIELWTYTAACESIFGATSPSGCPKVTMWTPPGRHYVRVTRPSSSTVAIPFGYTLVTSTGPRP